MKNRWINTKTDAEALSRSRSFWEALANDLDVGNFWADRIKEYKAEPKKRLEEALDNLPLPAAFRQAAVALRGLIREKRQKKANFEEELSFLYWLAAIDSFSIPYSEKLKEPGYNIFESIPGERIRKLRFTYDQLGYKQLRLLNGTDIKWFVESWGEPSIHTTLHEIHKPVWIEFENKLIQKRRKEIFYLSS
ncbi:MAG: hypothetical protein PHU44_03915 [Syntrophales bacterium]|nr:hypothetical protein [Syntrophales bacterium]MDD5640573.1 hypothetical protein [Syntrophales bacterium]